MAVRYLLTEAVTGRFLGLFREFDDAHAYAQNRLKTRIKKVRGEDVVEDFIDTEAKTKPIPPEEWTKHYLYHVDAVEVE